MCYSYPIKNASRRAVRPTILMNLCLKLGRQTFPPGVVTPSLARGYQSYKQVQLIYKCVMLDPKISMHRSHFDDVTKIPTRGSVSHWNYAEHKKNPIFNSLDISVLPPSRHIHASRLNGLSTYRVYFITNMLGYNSLYAIMLHKWRSLFTKL